MKNAGRLRIGDDWNAITIIALSQQNPLKAVAEFVENSIDASARNITIIRGRDKGQHFLRIKDDGQGIPKDEIGLIFDTFFRATNAKNAHTEGSGLGLDIAVEGHTCPTGAVVVGLILPGTERGVAGTGKELLTPDPLAPGSRGERSP